MGTDFKVGDLVLLDSSKYSISNHSQAVVQKVTPGGQVTVKGIKFKNGRQMGEMWTAAHIYHWDEIKHRHLVEGGRMILYAIVCHGKFDFITENINPAIFKTYTEAYAALRAARGDDILSSSFDYSIVTFVPLGNC